MLNKKKTNSKIIKKINLFQNKLKKKNEYDKLNAPNEQN